MQIRFIILLRDFKSGEVNGTLNEGFITIERRNLRFPTEHNKKPMRIILIVLAMASVSMQVLAQEGPLASDGPRSGFLGINALLIRGNSPLYALDGPIISKKDITEAGIEFYYLKDLAKSVFIQIAFQAFSIATNYRLQSDVNQPASIVSRSSMIAIPIQFGTRMIAGPIRFEAAVGLEYDRIISLRETRFENYLIEQAEKVDPKSLEDSPDQFRILATFGGAMPISDHIHSFIGTQANLGLQDQHTRYGIRRPFSWQMKLGLRYILL